MGAAVHKVAVWLLFLWLLANSRGSQGTRLASLQQILAPDTTGLVFEWRSPEDSHQLMSPGSGSSGWRLINPTRLCPLIADALSAMPPECVKLEKVGNLSEPTLCKETAPHQGCAVRWGTKTGGETRPASACAWEGGSGACGNVPHTRTKISLLRSTIVLPAPLDPLLERAFSHRTAVVHSEARFKDEKDPLQEKPSHFGVFFLRKSLELGRLSGDDSNDCEASALRDGLVVERVSRELTGSGAHRQLATKLVLTPRGANVSGRGPVGSVALVEALPSGVYADKFELQRMASDGVASVASVFGPVDIERPAPECTQSLVVAYSRPVEAPGGKLEANFVVPLHSRYPAVASGAPETPGDPHHTSVEVGLPVYVLWTESPGLFAEGELRMHDGWRHATWQQLSANNDTRQMVPGDGAALEQGRGKDAVVRWKVPHGQAEHAARVRVGTAASCFAATAFLLFVVIKT